MRDFKSIVIFPTYLIKMMRKVIKLTIL